MTSAIYKIENTSTGDCYIGASVRIERRWKDHRCALRRGSHYNWKLQEAWNKYGEEKFVFSVLRECPADLCSSLELEYIDALNPGYNLCRHTAHAMVGISRSAETKRKIAKAITGKVHTEETKAHLSRIRKGKKQTYVRTPEHRRKLAEAMKRRWEEGKYASCQRKRK